MLIDVFYSVCHIAGEFVELLQKKQPELGITGGGCAMCKDGWTLSRPRYMSVCQVNFKYN